MSSAQISIVAFIHSFLQLFKVAMLFVVQVSSRIWEQVIVSLHPDSFKDVSAFIAWLPSDQPEGKAGAAAALLANLAQVSGTALQVQALHFCTCHIMLFGQPLRMDAFHPQKSEILKPLVAHEPIWCVMDFSCMLSKHVCRANLQA